MSEQWVVRVVRMVAPSEQIIGPFPDGETAWDWLDANRAALNLVPHQAPQIMPLTPLTPPVAGRVTLATSRVTTLAGGLTVADLRLVLLGLPSHAWIVCQDADGHWSPSDAEFLPSTGANERAQLILSDLTAPG